MNLLRSLLFIPGNKAGMLEKAFTCSADAIVPDMEDSVPDTEKKTARDTIAEYLPRLRTTGRFICPRVNALETGLTQAELTAVIGPDVDAISIGKIRTPTDISEVSRMIGELERERDIAVGTIRLIPWIETARAILECHAICMASRRIVGVAFGAEDFTNDLGIEHVDDESNLVFARSSVCIAARAAGVTAFDTPYFRFRDRDGLREHSRKSRSYGFKGRFAIHPAQTDTINECFAPSNEEIEQARRIVAAYEAAERGGRASTSLDGVVIDVPVVKRARALLELAESIH
ncbi:MAG: CoA ester lyase [Gammaproteobacteria bacterium]|jgi:citrate lyase subunit beta/citryl-CoA lyase